MERLMPEMRLPALNLSRKLPEICNQIFVGRTGFIGVRCVACGFVMTARTLTELQASVWHHDHYAHLPAEADLAQNGEELDDVE
jgi:hypothetical protein